MTHWSLDPSERRALIDYLETTVDDERSWTVEPVPDQPRKLAVHAGDQSFLLQGPRRRPTPITRSLEEEYGVLEALAHTSVPVPEPIACCHDDTVLGVPFYLVERLDGAVIPAGEDVPARFQCASHRAQLSRRLIETLATLHNANISSGLPSVSIPTRLATYETMLADATAVTDRDLPELKTALDWLQETPPEPAPSTLVHGDLLPHNVVFSPTATPAIAGVIDWEFAARTDPRTDLGFLLACWDQSDDHVPIDDLCEEYAGHPHRDALDRLQTRGLWPFTREAGACSRTDLVDAYEAATGRPVGDVRYFHVLGAVKAAILWETWHRYRLEDGETEPQWEVIVRYQARRCRVLLDG